jgi:hypothetical protein
MTAHLDQIAHRIWDFVQLAQALEFVHRSCEYLTDAIGTAFTKLTLSLLAPMIEFVETTIKVVFVVGLATLCLGGILGLYLRSARPAAQ